MMEDCVVRVLVLKGFKTLVTLGAVRKLLAFERK